MLIDNWNCDELYPGEPWCIREASRGNVSVTADSDGIEITESGLGYSGGGGRYSIPANVLIWLAQAIR